jgi:AcrR family transcriptional regulator
MQDKIKDTAWDLMAEVGAARFSMRELGRRMGISAPALYNYYANQDNLLTALVIDGYGGLATAMEQAHSGVMDKSPAEQFLTVVEAHFDWANTHEVRYELIYGTPIKGYDAPLDLTVPQVVRLNAVLAAILEQAAQKQQLRPREPYDVIPAEELPKIEAIIAAGKHPVSPQPVYLAMICLEALSGFITYAKHGHLTPLDYAVQFRVRKHALRLDLGLIV